MKKTVKEVIIYIHEFFHIRQFLLTLLLLKALYVFINLNILDICPFMYSYKCLRESVGGNQLCMLDNKLHVR